MSKEENIEIVDVHIKDLLPTVYLIQELAKGHTQHLLKLVRAGIVQIGTSEEADEIQKKVSEDELNNLKTSQISILESQLNKLREEYSLDGYDPSVHGYLKVYRWENQKYVVDGTQKWHVLKDLYGEDYNLNVKEIYEKK